MGIYNLYTSWLLYVVRYLSSWRYSDLWKVHKRTLVFSYEFIVHHYRNFPFLNPFFLIDGVSVYLKIRGKIVESSDLEHYQLNLPSLIPVKDPVKSERFYFTKYEFTVLFVQNVWFWSLHNQTVNNSSNFLFLLT